MLLAGVHIFRPDDVIIRLFESGQEVCQDVDSGYHEATKLNHQRIVEARQDKELFLVQEGKDDLDKDA